MNEPPELPTAERSRGARSARVRWLITLIVVVVGIGLLLKTCGPQGRHIGDAWYVDDAPASLQPHGNDPGERVPVTENHRFWAGVGEKNEFIGRRLTLSGTVDNISHEYRVMTISSAGQPWTLDCYWGRENDPSFQHLQAGGTVHLSGIYRLRWSPSIAEGNPTWPALEACTIEP